MARVSDGTNVPISRAPASSSDLGSPNGSLPNLEGPGFRASTMEEKINEIHLQLPLFNACPDSGRPDYQNYQY